VLERVEIFQEVLPLVQRQVVPHRFEEAVVSVGDDACHQRAVEARNLVSSVSSGVLSQNCRAARSTFVNVVGCEKLSRSGSRNFTPLYSILIDFLSYYSVGSEDSALQADWHSPIIEIQTFTLSAGLGLGVIATSEEMSVLVDVGWRGVWAPL
jgi:hypothetical protein